MLWLSVINFEVVGSGTPGQGVPNYRLLTWSQVQGSAPSTSKLGPSRSLPCPRFSPVWQPLSRCSTRFPSAFGKTTYGAPYSYTPGPVLEFIIFYCCKLQHTVMLLLLPCTIRRSTGVMSTVDPTPRIICFHHEQVAEHYFLIG